MIISIFMFLIIFFVVVISHEFGHFIVAKKNGIHVVEFFIGMGPNLFSFEKGGTKYSIKLLPLGGACMFEGEDGVEKESGEMSEGAFSNAPVWARIATIFAGPFFNFLTAYLMAIVLVWFCGVRTTEIQRVTPGGAAEQAGLQVGDVITSIDGKKVHMNEEIQLSTFLNTKGSPMLITYEREGREYSARLQPIYNEKAGSYKMGVVAGKLLVCSVPQTFQYAVYTMKYTADATIKSLGMLVSGKLSRQDVSGPVGMVKMVDDMYTTVKPYGWENVLLNMLNLALLLSVNLGIMNLLPIPALDGGRLVFLLAEAVRGKPIPPEKEGLVHLAGMMALMVLMAFVLVNDITKFF